MANPILNISLSLDGVVAGPNGEGERLFLLIQPLATA